MVMAMETGRSYGCKEGSVGGTMESRFGSVEARIGGIEQRLGSVEQRVGAIEVKLDTVLPTLATREDLQRAVSATKDGFNAGDAALRAEMHAGFASLREETQRGFSELRGELNVLTRWMVATMLTLVGLTGTLVMRGQLTLAPTHGVVWTTPSVAMAGQDAQTQEDADERG